MKFKDASNSFSAACQQLVKRLCLSKSPGKAIENEALFAIILLDPVLNDADDDLVAHKTTGSHYFLGFLADLSLSSHSFPQHVPS